MTTPTLPDVPPAGTIARARTYLDRIDATDAGASLMRLDGVARIRLLCEQATAAAAVASAAANMSIARSTELAALVSLVQLASSGVGPGMTAEVKPEILARIRELAGIGDAS